MYFKKSFLDSDNSNVKYLAPIPLWVQQFDDDELHDELYEMGLDKLNSSQKKMGQELPNQYDGERVDHYEVNYDRSDNWVEENEFNPIGSRFYTPPNDFLNIKDKKIDILNQRIKSAYTSLLDYLDISNNKNPAITESWMQYYNPYDGRGHNAHNHCRWKSEEQVPNSFSGGYYLSDGAPLLDHPYSGVFTFHIRGAAHFIRPKKGMLLIWPYDIVHSVKPFYGKSPRCVINFNIHDKPSKTLV